MHEIYELKDMLCKELEKYGSKELTAGSLEVIDKLAHAVKNLGKIIEMDEEEYSGYYPYMGGSYEDDSHMGGSYARGRRSRTSMRDSRGRYSSRGYSRASEDAVEQLRSIMEEVPEHMKSDVKRLITKMESM